jgi:16S rRNA (cytosine1407-C5)-methyltransferase
MKGSDQAKQTVKRHQLIARTAQALGVDEAQAEQLLTMEHRQSFRVNSLKVAHPAVALKQLQAAGWQGEQYAWYALGYAIAGDKRTVSDSTPAQEGAVYVQNAASWLPVLALEPRPGEKILDMCAAPGGKAAHILELTQNQAEVWANDNSRPRLAKMQANFQRLGARPAQLTLYDVTHLARKLGGEQFDKILLDAPCSGEGMLQLDNPKDLATWSVAHIHRLQNLQKRAILQAWQLLKPGGTLVYSTCTMAPEENEAVVDYALRRCEGAQLVPLTFPLPNIVPAVQTWNGKRFSQAVAGCLRLAPSRDIEAFFVAKLCKLDTSANTG